MKSKVFLTVIAAIGAVAGISWGVVLALKADVANFNPLAPDPEVIKAANALIAERKRHDQTVWVAEVDAQRYESTFVKLWDDLRGAEERHRVLKDFQFKKLQFPALVQQATLDHGIQLLTASGAPEELSHQGWEQLVDKLYAAGLRVIQTEWHHAKFLPAEQGIPASEISFTLHLLNTKTQSRIIVKGTLEVVWSVEKDKSGNALPQSLTLRDAKVLQRRGQPAFRQIELKELRADSFAAFYDLDRDGDLDVVTGPNNVWWNLGENRFQHGPLCAEQDLMLTCGALADVNGDGYVDLICGGRNEHLRWYAGVPKGRRGDAFFPDAPKTIQGTPPLTNPSVITVGDIDGDLDLDMWVAQYKYPYLKGQMPTPYFDANDGFPSYLLINRGNGTFDEQTDQRGLNAKRLRRTYSASFLDLDGDDDLDLLVNSDFSGVDLYRNDGGGKFTDARDEWVEEWHNFGMSHTIADFDLNGELDFFITGMSSTTARRLDSLNLGRKSFDQHQKMRTVMGYGNRMYLRKGDGFREPEFRATVARTGWSWGSTAFDFDNDGDADIYIANGHISGNTARDYCTKFWCHDIYTGSSEHNKATELVFKTDSALKGISWNGFEHNCLLMNKAGKGFVEIGFLNDVAFEFDSRAIISGDLDGDGRVDLYVGKHQTDGYQEGRLLQNRFTSPDANWIGVRLYEEGDGYTPMGAKIRVVTKARTHVKQIVSGDSFNAQHGNVVHFGLGTTRQVQAIEVRWPNGKTHQLKNPVVGRYHLIQRSDKSASAN